MQCLNLLSSVSRFNSRDEGFVLENTLGNHALIDGDYGDSLAVFTTEEIANDFAALFGLDSVQTRLHDRGALLEIALSKEGCVGYCVADHLAMG